MHIISLCSIQKTISHAVTCIIILSHSRLMPLSLQIRWEKYKPFWLIFFPSLIKKTINVLFPKSWHKNPEKDINYKTNQKISTKRSVVDEGQRCKIQGPPTITLREIIGLCGWFWLSECRNNVFQVW